MSYFYEQTTSQEGNESDWDEAIDYENLLSLSPSEAQELDAHFHDLMMKLKQPAPTHALFAEVTNNPTPQGWNTNCCASPYCLVDRIAVSTRTKLKYFFRLCSLSDGVSRSGYRMKSTYYHVSCFEQHVNVFKLLRLGLIAQGPCRLMTVTDSRGSMNVCINTRVLASSLWVKHNGYVDPLHIRQYRKALCSWASIAKGCVSCITHADAVIPCFCGQSPPLPSFVSTCRQKRTLSSVLASFVGELVDGIPLEALAHLRWWSASLQHDPNAITAAYRVGFVTPQYTEANDLDYNISPAALNQLQINIMPRETVTSKHHLQQLPNLVPDGWEPINGLTYEFLNQSTFAENLQEQVPFPNNLERQPRYTDHAVIQKPSTFLEAAGTMLWSQEEGQVFFGDLDWLLSMEKEEDVLDPWVCQVPLAGGWTRMGAQDLSGMSTRVR